MGGGQGGVGTLGVCAGVGGCGGIADGGVGLREERGVERKCDFWSLVVRDLLEEGNCWYFCVRWVRMCLLKAPREDVDIGECRLPYRCSMNCNV